MNLYQKGLTEFQEMYYTYAVLGVIASSCIGSIAAMLILMSGTSAAEMVQLFLVVAVAMWYNASVLAQLKAKFVYNSLVLSLLISVVLIVFHLTMLYL
ncbi:hypothetical protein [Planktosalinus lacus]|uniref:Uncharacterized protein n=1 Tax=Planktosalinus lacus TaxID=1526573 RepID=A0A8J2V753_9FLAO|nr:hypothetical protein [Planktosalinus lacus]GGD83515.1 hypothetical protein GCM10011312_04500 [Planktosalinus lacus]